MKTDVKFWMRLSLISIAIVALLGTVMRYKIGFEFPYFDQKFIQHGHSHFAFAAWVTQTLMVFMLHFLEKQKADFSIKRYNLILYLNLFSAYGMLIAFLCNGYNAFSIAFSQISILVFYAFTWTYFQDIKTLKHPSFPWFKAALVFGLISSLGTYVLAYMMGSKHIVQTLYLGSVYFFLHFQYNGYFLFACLGLLIAAIHAKNADWKPNKNVFLLLCSACAPAYLLSVLWLKLPIWVLILVSAAAIAQFTAWFILISDLIKNRKTLFVSFHGYLQFLLAIIAIAYTIKLLLQLGSTIPEVSKLAFGFRPIVIAYLHLILLAIISVFLLTYMHILLFEKAAKPARISLLIFAASVYVNEIILTVQGIASFSYTIVPYVNELLFIVALISFTAAVLMLTFQKMLRFQE